MTKRHWILGGLGCLLVTGAVLVEALIGWSNVIGMWRYDTRREGDLKVGDQAPAVAVVEVATGAVVPMFATPLARPLVLVFGSFT